MLEKIVGKFGNYVSGLAMAGVLYYGCATTGTRDAYLCDKQRAEVNKMIDKKLEQFRKEYETKLKQKEDSIKQLQKQLEAEKQCKEKEVLIEKKSGNPYLP
jgi:pantothenate synthetase